MKFQPNPGIKVSPQLERHIVSEATRLFARLTQARVFTAYDSSEHTRVQIDLDDFEGGVPEVLWFEVDYLARQHRILVECFGDDLELITLGIVVV